MSCVRLGGIPCTEERRLMRRALERGSRLNSSLQAEVEQLREALARVLAERDYLRRTLDEVRP